MTLIQTSDGSHTLKHPTLDEHYHSIHGAIEESEFVFIAHGFEKYSERDQIKILEVGFGTGLNGYLTLLNRPQHQQVYYEAIEPFPVPLGEALQLNYPSQLGQPSDIFATFHQSKWNESVKIDPSFQLHKRQCTLQDWSSDKQFDLVYFDAFSPDIAPEMWTVELFSKIAQSLNPGGCLVTYCVKGMVKRHLREAGFAVKRLPGPPNKRHILCATLYAV